MPPHLCPNSSGVSEPVVTTSLQDHTNVQRNLPVARAIASNTRILHVLLLDVPFTKYRQYLGWYVIYFTPFSSKAACLGLHLGLHITNAIPPRLPNISPSTILYFTLMSTPPTPSIQDSSPSKFPVDPMTALIALMTQQL